jgi:hypothetical protein
MRKISNKAIKERWFEWPKDQSVKVLLRPFPASQTMLVSTTADGMSNINWEIFNFCLLDWKGYVGDDDRPLKCTDKNKKLVFDFDREMILFIIESVGDFESKIVIQKKT